MPAVKEKEQELHVQLLEVKARASELSGEVTRQSKLLGAAHDRIEKLEKVEEDNKALEEDLRNHSRQISSLERQLREAQALADAGSKAVAAGKQIADGLAQLKSL